MSVEQEKLDKNIKENWFSKVGVHKPYTIFVCIMAIIILGIFAFSSMKVDLFPNMNLPYAVVVVSPNQAALSEAFADKLANDTALQAEMAGIGAAAAEKAKKQYTDQAVYLADLNELSKIAAGTSDYASMADAAAAGNYIAACYLELYSEFAQKVTFGLLAEKAPVEQMNALTTDVLSALSVLNGVHETQSNTMVTMGTAIFMLEYENKATIDTAALLLAMDSVGITNEANYGMIFDKRIMQLDPSMMPIMRVTVTCKGHENDDAWFEKNLLNKLKSTTGVGEISTNIDSSTVSTNQDAAWQSDGEKLLATRRISIQKSSNAVTTEVAANVLAVLEGVKTTYPDFSYDLTSSQADYINLSIGAVGENLIVGGILALIILFLFLRSLKMTLAIGISIPLAVVGTFVAMHFMGIGLNIISMSGLALAVGMLVDNSVVVLENIFRLRQKGLPIKEAAIKGASQIMAGMLASTLTTICVFFPMFFLEGLIMEVFTDLIWVVILSLMCSFVVAIMFLPGIVSTFKIDAKPKKVKELKPNWWQKFTAKVSAVFDKVLRLAINKKWLTVALAFLVFIGSAALLLVNGFIILPSTDEGAFTVTATLNQTGSTVADKQTDLAQPMYAKLKDLLGSDLDKCVIEYVSGTDTMSMLSGASESMSVSIKLTDKRKLSTDEASDKVYKALQDFDTTHYSEVAVSSSSLTSTLAASDVSVMLTSGKGDIRQALRDLDAFNAALNAKFDQQLCTDLQIKKIEWTQNAVITGDELDDVQVLKIEKVDNKIITTFTIKAFSDADLNQIQTQLDTFVDELLQSERFQDQDLSVWNDGMAAQLNETYSSMGIALLVGLLLIYLVMVAIFQSFLMPFIILICVPLGFTGAFLLLFLCQMPLSLPALIGFLILMGVVINNGILAVDYTNQARRDGLSIKEALVAAMHTRMRPIFMTALTTILAMLPMALGISLFNAGGSSAIIQPLAVVSIGGLLFGTLTTLIVVPAFYAIFCREQK